MSTGEQRPEDRGFRIRTELAAGDLGKIITLHGQVYDHEEGFGLPFEAFVAKTVAEFILDNDGRGRIWLAERHDEIVGCIAIARRDGERGQLRWLVVKPTERGRGIGRTLFDAAMDYCRRERLEAVYLETTPGLDASMHLYVSSGFRVVRDTTERLWAGDRRLIVMEKPLASGGDVG